MTTTARPPRTFAITVGPRTHHKIAAHAARHGLTMRAAADELIGALLDADGERAPTPTYVDHADPGLL